MQEILERWRKVTAELDPELGEPDKWAEEPIGYFLYAFRPDGARLAELFEGMPEMAPVLERLRVIFERAGPETGHMYFIVSRPRAMEDDEVKRTVVAWLNNVAELVDELGVEVDEDIMEFLANDAAEVDVIDGEPPARSPSDVHPVTSAIYRAVIAGGEALNLSEAGLLLVEPLYMLTCSYELAYWVLSPLDPDSPDCFAPAAALWEAHIDVDFEGEGESLRAVAYRRDLTRTRG